MALKKILLVDDDPISLQVLNHYLRDHYNVITAADGLQAWQLLQEYSQEFVLVIADRIMPKLHGLQLLEQMQTHPELNNVPLILLTGEADKDEQIAAIKAGIFDFLYKPVAKQLLLNVVKRALNRG